MATFRPAPARVGSEGAGRLPPAASARSRLYARGRGRDRASLRARQARDPADRVAGLRALYQGHQRAEEAAERGHSGAQLQTPEIFHCVADVVGDSLQLAREASKADADVIVQCGVHFMAETSKLLNPDKTVLIPDMRRRLLAGRVDHRRRRARAARALSRRAGRHLCQHLGRREGGVRYLLHLVERGARGRDRSASKR